MIPSGLQLLLFPCYHRNTTVPILQFTHCGYHSTISLQWLPCYHPLPTQPSKFYHLHAILLSSCCHLSSYATIPCYYPMPLHVTIPTLPSPRYHPHAPVPKLLPHATISTLQSQSIMLSLLSSWIPCYHPQCYLYKK